jgi:hypothetical protein
MSKAFLIIIIIVMMRCCVHLSDIRNQAKEPITIELREMTDDLERR